MSFWLPDIGHWTFDIGLDADHFDQTIFIVNRDLDLKHEAGKFELQMRKLDGVFRRRYQTLRTVSLRVSDEFVEVRLLVVMMIRKRASERRLVTLASNVIKKRTRVSHTAERSNRLRKIFFINRPAIECADSRAHHPRRENRNSTSQLLDGVL